jgi:hypothetical protein
MENLFLIRFLLYDLQPAYIIQKYSYPDKQVKADTDMATLGYLII